MRALRALLGRPAFGSRALESLRWAAPRPHRHATDARHGVTVGTATEPGAASALRWSAALHGPVPADDDLSRAFFEAADNVGHLKMSFYGTRDAAMNWQEEVAREMVKRGGAAGQVQSVLVL